MWLMGFAISAFTRVCNARMGSTHLTILILTPMRPIAATP